MPNGRALPSALLYDWLLGRAWSLALVSQANANTLGPENLVYDPGIADGSYAIAKFLSKYEGNESAALVQAHDQALNRQLQGLADDWAAEFKGLIDIVAPIGPGFLNAVEWLRKVVNGGDGLGYIGQDHRAQQALNYGIAIDAGLNERGLPTPPGAMAALRTTSTGVMALHYGNMNNAMTATALQEAQRLRIDAAEALIKARDDALDATLDYLFTEMTLMFDVFGRNNNYLTKLQRDVGAMRNRMAVRGAELSDWEARVQQLDDRRQATIQRSEEFNKRQVAKLEMEAEAQIKMLRRYSSRAASAINSAGVSVTSQAQESNEIDAEG